ncbi:hypothetical protein ACSZMT_15265 [Aeromonas veronii]|uniref:hypothetical protein n=1 Tax=Aeromonas veronii TaxID=654 RepID=UPI003EC56C3A
MELTGGERALTLAGRAEQEQLEAAKAFRQKAVETASAWLAWAKEDGHGLTFSTFVNQFNYEERDCKQMYRAVERILDAALPEGGS